MYTSSGAISVGGKKAVKATFNQLGGMCPRCEGRGSVSDIDLSQLYDEEKSLALADRIDLDTVDVITDEYAYGCVVDKFDIPLGAQRVTDAQARSLTIPGVTS